MTDQPRITDKEMVDDLAKLWDAPVDVVERAWNEWKNRPNLSDLYRFGLTRASVRVALGRKKLAVRTKPVAKPAGKK